MSRNIIAVDNERDSNLVKACIQQYREEIKLKQVVRWVTNEYDVERTEEKKNANESK